MPWKCFMVESIRSTDWEPCETGTGRIQRSFYKLPDGREVGFSELPVGAMWWNEQHPHSIRGVHGRSLCVRLPGNVIWYMHHPGTNGCKWTVTGDPPNVTASPSINFMGIYHGWVQNGVVTDDCEGRRFNADGCRI